MKVINIEKGNINSFFSPDFSNPMPILIASGTVPAGFPSPAADFEENSLDLNSYLIKHKSATFYAKVKGDSMKDAGIHDGDLLVVDRSLEAGNRDIALCYIDGEYTVKRLIFEGEVIFLMPENEKYEPIRVDKNNELIIWGVVISVVKKFK